MSSMLKGEAERERLQTLVLAAESWSPVYEESPEAHAKLIRLSARFERNMRRYFRDMAARADDLINWPLYAGFVRAAASVDVVVYDDLLDEFDGMFITIAFEDIVLATTLGAQAGESLYRIPLGLTPTSQLIQDEAREHTAELVGKKIDKNGLIIPNPRAQYRISDKTRKDIISSIQTAISLGETRPQVVERLQKTIKNPVRAEMIARTEMVNAYQGGEFRFAKASNAVGHEWEDNGATDVCADNTAAGAIPINQTFPSGHACPTAHPHCKCGKRYIYAREWVQRFGELPV